MGRRWKVNTAAALLLALASPAVGLAARGTSLTVEEILSARNSAEAAELRSGLEKAGSEPEAAAKSLEELADRFELLEDYALYFAALAHRDRGEAGPAAASLERITERWRASPLAAVAAAELAELRLARDEKDGIPKLAERFAEAKAPAEARARLWLAAGRASAERDAKRAAKYFGLARSVAPDVALAREAGDAMRALRLAHRDLEPRTAGELIEEAERLAREQRFDLQSRVVAAYLDLEPSGDDRHRAVMLGARGLAFSKGKKAAADWLMGLVERTAGPAAKARLVFESAIFDWNGNHDSRALEKLETVLRMSTGIDEEQRARYASGRIHEAFRRYSAAAKSYRAAVEGKDRALAAESEWRAGWVSYLAENYTGAAFVFARLAARAGAASNPVPGSREEALYWQGRSLERDGQEKAAMAVFEKLLDETPDGFYAYLVERRKGLRANRPEVHALADLDDRIAHPLARALQRAAALGGAGLTDRIDAEVESALPRRDTQALRSALPMLDAVGAHAAAMRVALDLYFRKKLTEQELYPYLYPRAYSAVVEAEAARRGLSPYLVYALMRQESAFGVSAVSPAQACGLMQLLPSTARRIAKEAGVQVSDCTDLFDPETNIKLGTTYLAKLAALFESDAILMLAGYNAGERAAARWQGANAGLDEDEFIERISYTETRGYVKKVLRNYRNYTRLYARPEADSAPSDASSGR